MVVFSPLSQIRKTATGFAPNKVSWLFAASQWQVRPAADDIYAIAAPARPMFATPLRPITIVIFNNPMRTNIHPLYHIGNSRHTDH
jgi:hypothetical protein